MGTIDSIPPKILKNIEIQSNGIIRNSKGYIIGRLSKDILFDSKHLITCGSEKECNNYQKGCDVCSKITKYPYSMFMNKK